MAGNAWGKRWATSLALACALAGCGAKEEPQTQSRPLRPRGAFDPALMDLNRPCTLLTADDAAEVSGQPFYRTMAANLVHENNVRCAQGVGHVGLHGMVELDVVTPLEGETIDVLFARYCRDQAAPAPAGPAVTPAPALAETVTPTADSEAAAPAPPPPPPPPPPVAIEGRHCIQRTGGVALMLPEQVLLARVRLSAGEIDPEGSRRLGSLISQRVLGN